MYELQSVFTSMHLAVASCALNSSTHLVSAEPGSDLSDVSVIAVGHPATPLIAGGVGGGGGGGERWQASRAGTLTLSLGWGRQTPPSGSQEWSCIPANTHNV